MSAIPHKVKIEIEALSDDGRLYSEEELRNIENWIESGLIAKGFSGNIWVRRIRLTFFDRFKMKHFG